MIKLNLNDDPKKVKEKKKYLARALGMFLLMISPISIFVCMGAANDRDLNFRMVGAVIVTALLVIVIIDEEDKDPYSTLKPAPSEPTKPAAAPNKRV